MADFDSNFIKAIVDELEKRLSRKLTKAETEAFTLKRSGLAYEMMMDFISDDSLTELELEKYIKEVVAELK